MSMVMTPKPSELVVSVGGVDKDVLSGSQGLHSISSAERPQMGTWMADMLSSLYFTLQGRVLHTVQESRELSLESGIHSEKPFFEESPQLLC